MSINLWVCAPTVASTLYCHSQPKKKALCVAAVGCRGRAELVLCSPCLCETARDESVPWDRVLNKHNPGGEFLLPSLWKSNGREGAACNSQGRACCRLGARKGCIRQPGLFLGYPRRAQAEHHLKGLQLRGELCTGWGLGRGTLLTSALTAGLHIPAAVFDMDPAVHVTLRLVVVVNQAAVQVEDEPVSFPAAQDGA